MQREQVWNHLPPATSPTHTTHTVVGKMPPHWSPNLNIPPGKSLKYETLVLWVRQYQLDGDGCDGSRQWRLFEMPIELIALHPIDMDEWWGLFFGLSRTFVSIQRQSEYLIIIPGYDQCLLNKYSLDNHDGSYYSISVYMITWSNRNTREKHLKFPRV